MTDTCNRKISARTAGGFTLAEVLVASLIVGMCIVGAMVAIESTTKLTSASSQITKATLLAQEIREWSMNVDYANISSTLVGTNEPPKDSTGETLAGYSGWTESVSVTYLTENNIAVDSGGVTTDVARITVALSYGGSLVLQTSWLVVANQP